MITYGVLNLNLNAITLLKDEVNGMFFNFDEYAFLFHTCQCGQF